MKLLDHLLHFFTRRAPVEPSDRLLIAFSGGPDSTALAWGLSRLADQLGLHLALAHLDHGLDPDSAARASQAARLARRLDLPWIAERRDVERRRRSGESPEAAARRVRYDFLDDCARSWGARYLATAHHRDDQAETVLLRILQGSGPAGLAAIRERRGQLVRPLLRLGRAELAAALAETGLEPVLDPTNHDLRVPRNRVRQLLRPRLERRYPGLARRLPALAEAAAAAAERVHDLLSTQLRPRRLENGGVEVDRRRLEGVPEPLRPYALALLHELAGCRYPPSASSAGELFRQLERGAGVGCDCGGGWRWRSAGGQLRLAPASIEQPPTPFAYDLPVPGEIELPEIGRRFRIEPTSPRDWMFRGAPRRAGLRLPTDIGPLKVRSRRPGDRIRPLGCPYDRRLKQVLIDRRVPRRERDRLPLLCAGRRVLWVPGATIDEICRVDRNRQVWSAEIADR